MDRRDVVEELQRLTTHLERGRAELDAEGPHGKRLEFLLAEMSREANTLSTKTRSPRATDLRGAVQRLREQAANVE